MVPESENTENSIPQVFAQIQNLVCQGWQETGFGSLVIESERINCKKIRIVIRGSTHYKYVISDEEVEQWVKTQELP